MATIHSLPPEILTKIFTYLPLRDRKSVRLTCPLWHDCCTRLSIRKKEKFVFRNGCCIQEITKLLTGRQYVNLNLEFQGMPVDLFPVALWKKCGNRIVSLDFYECKLDDRTVKNIVVLCTSLKSFKFTTSYCCAENHFDVVFCSSKTLNDLINQNVVRRSLLKFEIFVDDARLPSHIFRKIFQIYPCIRSFGTGCRSFDHMDFIGAIMMIFAERTPLFSRIDKYLLPGVTEKLRFNFPTDGRWMKQLKSSALRLRKLETIVIESDTTFESVLAFFASQRDLEVLRLSVAQAQENSIKRLLFHVLAACRNLRELRLNFAPTRLHLTGPELLKLFLLTSRLECLSLNFIVRDNTCWSSGILQAISPSVNRNLHTLKLESDGLDEYTTICLVTYCRNLRHLELCHVTDNVLQELFKTQTGLETLILNQIDVCSDFGFTGITTQGGEQVPHSSYSIARLRELQHLEIESFCSSEITMASCYALTFPCLKYLRLSVDLSCGEDNPLMHITKNAPLLETVIIEGMNMSFKNLLEFCESSKSLYRLNYEIIENYSAIHIQKLFCRCPTLRFLSDSDDHIYYYNPLSNKISEKNLYTFKFKEDTAPEMCAIQ